MLSLILVSTFTGAIASLLTVGQLNNTLTNPESLKELKSGTVVSSATHDYLRRNFYRNIETYPNLNKGLNALLNDEVEI